MILAYASTIGKPDLEINHWIEEMEEAIHLVDKISLPPSENKKLRAKVDELPLEYSLEILESTEVLEDTGTLEK